LEQNPAPVTGGRVPNSPFFINTFSLAAIIKKISQMKITYILTFLFLTTTTFGQTFTKEIDGIYDFKPSKLTDKEQETKMPSLDKFWDKVKNDTTKYLPMLRTELKTKNHNPYFYYDGSGLLLTLTNNKLDKQLGVEAIAKSDLSDISQKIYVTTLNRLAHEGIDVTKPAIKILDVEDYSFFIPQHAMSFNQGYCLAYMLLPQQNSNYIDTIISIFKDLKPNAQKAVITTLWFAYSCKGDDFLKLVIADKALKKEVSTYAKKIMGLTKIEKMERDYLKTLDVNELKNMRKASLQRFSDEAIGELDLTTRLMREKNNCR
jgi:hypothetical protein